ncbi:Protein translocase subunit SecD [Rosistilla ulvae]|uniref:Protein translocase subunit SecD n=1 Tax=Rosistilla ulvae TaxID=1930277 RepID=A0A517M3K0_9BACT|nr:MMPL family transporter [Rosistilla ulvae]QDS89456.1 Protein translocase subunit SecD [Rosistilla ulvae]
MKPTFLARRSIFGINNALLILLVVCFLAPIGIRGARQSLQSNNNNVKDWLPSDFPETTELEWFGDYFSGERFVIATWPGCDADDQKLKLLTEKLRSEAEGAEPSDAPPDWQRARKLAEELQLLAPNDFQTNWGGRNEKWLNSPDGTLYYITPDGRLFRWAGKEGPLPALIRSVRKLLRGGTVEGQFIASFGETAGQPDSDKLNPYYNDPHLLTAALFRTIQTGPEIAEQLAQENGPLWPVAAINKDDKKVIAERLAEKRLTGTLFAPAVPIDFEWTAEAFADQVPAASLPEQWEYTCSTTIKQIVDEHFGGELSKLKNAPTDVRDQHWYDIFDAMGVQPPPRQSCVLVTLTPVALDNLPYVVGRGLLGGPRGRLLQLAEESGINAAAAPSAVPPPFNYAERHASLVEPAMRMGGPPVDNVSIDEEGQITLIRLIGYCVLIGLSLSMLAFRSFKITSMIFVVGVLAAVSSLAFVQMTGEQIDAILMSMPSLVYILGLSGAIHIINYYREETAARGVEGAAERAVSHAFMPCTLAAITTAIGLLSLNTSNIIPIKKFGFYSAIGVVATLVLLFAYLPAALHIFRPEPAAEKKPRPTKRRGENDPDLLTRIWLAVGRWVTAHFRIVGVACMLLVVGAAMGLSKIETSVQLLKLFGSESRIIRDYGWIESHFGKLVPMELVLRVPPGMQRELDTDAHPAEPTALSQLERLQAVDHIQRAVESAFGEHGTGVVGNAMSAVTLMPELPKPTNSPTNATRLAFNSALASAQTQLLGSDYVQHERNGPWKDSELWRISLRVGALSDVDYGQFVGNLRDAVEPVLQAYRFRESVLESLGDEHKGIVFVVGADRPDEQAWENVLASDDESDLRDDGSETSAVDQRLIFEKTLDDLLHNESKIRKVVWIAPEKVKDSPNKLEVWARNFAKADCVVIAEDQADFDVEFINEHAPAVVDARPVQWVVSAPSLREGVPDVENAGPLQVVYTGIVPLVYKAQRTLLFSLVESTFLAFVLIGIVMSGLLNPGSWFGKLKPANILYGIGAGAVSMLPNLFPVIVIFGFLGHTGSIVDLGKMMTASVAMGVAVDDTIHFLEWFRQGLAQGMTRRESVMEAYRRVGPAMTQTTVLGGLGLFVFALSSFTPTQSFGIMMLLLLVAALVGDLVFLPAILVSPLGKLFRPRDEDLIAFAQGVNPHDPIPSSDETQGDEDENSSPAAGAGRNGADRIDTPHVSSRQNASAIKSRGDTVS